MFPLWLVGIQTIQVLLWAPGTSLIMSGGRFLGVFPPLPLGSFFFLYESANSTHPETCRSLYSFSVPFLSGTLLWEFYLCWPSNSQLHFFASLRPLGSCWIAFFCTDLEIPLGVTWGNHRAHLSCCPSLGNKPCANRCPIFENHCFINHVPLFRGFRWPGKLGLFSSFIVASSRSPCLWLFRARYHQYS